MTATFSPQNPNQIFTPRLQHQMRPQMRPQMLQQSRIEELMMVNPGLPIPTPQHRQALEDQLRFQSDSRQLQDATAARNLFLEQLQKAEHAAAAQRTAVAGAEVQAKGATARPDTQNTKSSGHVIQKYKQPAESDGRPSFRADFISPRRPDDFRPRGRQRAPETREEKRQRRLQELREQFEAENQGAESANAAMPAAQPGENVQPKRIRSLVSPGKHPVASK